MERKFQVSSGSSKRTVSGRVRSSRRRPGCIRLFVCPTTGGRLEISVSPRETVLGLKAALARKLRVTPSRLTLIYKDRVLKDGCLLDYKIPDESHVTLLPNMESGLSLHQSDKGIMKALENLSETQVNDFLSGRAPLMLAIRMREHMVCVQLQLSTIQSQTQTNTRAASSGGLPTMTPTAATVLSQTGLSATAIAEAARCLSQRLQRLREFNRPGATGRPSSSHRQMNSTPDTKLRRICPTSTPPVPAPTRLVPTADPNPTTPSTSTTMAGSPQTLLQLPTQPTLPVIADNTLPSPTHSPGAVIDNMRHMGQGMYTGTFSGTLDPSRQDGSGQPRRSINMILHILNDLLVAPTHNPPDTPKGEGHILNDLLLTPLHSPPATPKGEGRILNDLLVAPPHNPTATPKGEGHSLTISQAFPFNTGYVADPSCGVPENSDNQILRGKMQRIQMMLAQRKEQRRSRREMRSPYTSSKSSSHSSSTTLLSSPTMSGMPVCSTASTATSSCNNTASSSSSVASHSCESNGDAAYCKTSLEQDSLAV